MGWAAISVAQLNDLRQQAVVSLGEAFSIASMYDINVHLIRPACEQHGKPYAHIVNDGNLLKVQVFVSHAWAENFGEFVNSVNAAFHQWTVKPNIWICACALLQSSDPKVVAHQVASRDPRKAPFTRALRMAEKFLVVRNRSVDIYSRIWCYWELAAAHEVGFLDKAGSLMVAGPATFAEDGPVDIANANASSLSDKATILGHLIVKGSYASTNQKLTQVRQHVAELV